MKVKKKQVYSRKRSALHWLCAALLLWFLITQTLHLFLFFPRQTIRLAEEAEGIPQHTELLSTLSAPKGARPQRFYLSANDDAALLTTAHLVPVLGWQLDRSVALDCSAGQTFSFACQTIHRKNDPGQRLGLLVFGYIQDPSVHHLELFSGTVGPDSLLDPERLSLTPLVELGPETFLSRNEQRYVFLLCTDPQILSVDPSALLLRAYDQDGQFMAQKMPEIYG